MRGSGVAIGKHASNDPVALGRESGNEGPV